jgi:predicted TIM-barrel fold metal-dependent hydrolase
MHRRIETSSPRRNMAEMSYGDDHNRTLNSLREVVLYCIASFGPERAMFASDFRVTGLHATFDQTYGGFKTIVSEFSADEQRAIFFDNAKRTYCIDLECA